MQGWFILFHLPDFEPGLGHTFNLLSSFIWEPTSLNPFAGVNEILNVSEARMRKSVVITEHQVFEDATPHPHGGVV